MRVQSLELMRVEMKETPKISLKQKNEFCESIVNELQKHFDEDKNVERKKNNRGAKETDLQEYKANAQAKIRSFEKDLKQPNLPKEKQISLRTSCQSMKKRLQVREQTDTRKITIKELRGYLYSLALLINERSPVQIVFNSDADLHLLEMR